MKKFKLQGIIILLVSVILIWYVLKDNFTKSIYILMSSKIIWIIISFIIYFIYMLLESIVTKLLINQYNKKYSLKKTVNLTIMSKFFNGITPFAMGGQPLQVYELKKEGVKVTDGTIVMIEHFIIFQTSIVLISLISILFNTIFNFVKCGVVLNNLAILGFIVNIIILLFVYTISINKKISDKIFYPIIKLLSKIKLLKNKDKAISKWNNACLDYKNGYDKLVKNKKLLFKLLFIEILSLVIYFIMPLFVFKAIGYTENLNILICILISTYIFIVGSYIPIPGGSGGMEYAFYEYFSFYAMNSYLSPALLLWRTISYYVPLIIGGIVFNVVNKNNNL